jgi:RimJ/RimL family protein N-acetyltransferase
VFLVTDRKIILKGERVSLVEMLDEDQPIFHKWHSENEELLRLIDCDDVPTMEDQLKWYARSAQPDRRMFSIVLSKGELIGHGGFVDIGKEEKTAQLRITIGPPKYWGKGLGTEATNLIIQYGFEQMDLSDIWLRVRMDNERAIKAYEKLKFSRGELEDGGKILHMHLAK